MSVEEHSWYFDQVVLRVLRVLRGSKKRVLIGMLVMVLRRITGDSSKVRLLI